MIKLFFGIFFILALLGYVLLGINSYDDPYFELNGVSLSISDYKAIKEQFSEDKYVRVCNLETGDCILLTKLDGESN